MLFSSNEVADYINAEFEPAWESVRPVPIVTIDFGNGHTIRRTLHGNVATYLCGPDGVVYDVLPGIYAPAVYRQQLAIGKALAKSVHSMSKSERSLRLNDYHTRQATLLAATIPTLQMQAIARTGGGFKGGGGIGGGGFQGAGGFAGGGGFQGNGNFQGTGGGIEGPTERVVMGLPPQTTPGVVPSGPLAARPELVLDSQVNELIRRRTIHQKLAQLGPVHPDDIKKWLYKDVLRVDLDDPLLGLGAVLNANYPFAEEDRAAGK